MRWFSSDIIPASGQAVGFAKLTTGPGEITKHDRWLIAAAAIAALVFTFVGINRPVWVDEANCIPFSARGPAEIVDGLRVDNNLPVFYFVLWAWMQLFGDSEVALRLLCATFFVGGAFAAGLLTHAIFRTRRAALYGGLFFLISLQAIHQAQNERMYGLLGMLFGPSMLGVMRLWSCGRAPRTS